MKKAISLLLAAALMLTMLALPAAAEETAGYEDTNGHWAQSQIDEWTENGVIGGYKDNTFKPDNGMKVSEFVTTMVNTLGLTEASTGNPFKDLDSNEWYAKNLLIAHKAGILLGDDKGRCNADSYINRERALVIMGRALKIEPVKNPNLSQFGDGAKVSDWAAPMMAALVERKIVQGTGKDMLAPQATINRASAITALNGAVTTYIHKPGDYQVEDGGIVLVNTTGDVSLSGELSSDLLVVPGASGSMITMDNLAVSGNVYVQAPDAALLIKNSEINGTVAVEETASGTVLDVGAGSTVNKLTTAADEVAVTGSGELKSAEVLGGDKVSIDTKGTEVSVDKNAGEVTAGGETVKPGESTTTDSKPENNKPSTTPAPSYTGTVGKAILHDASGAIADADLVQDYTVSTQAASGYTKVTVSGKGLKYHQNGAGTNGYWIGFSLAAPEGVGVTQADVAFSDSESLTLSGSPEALAQEINENHDAGVAFYTNIGGNPEKHWALVQWYDAAGEKVGPEMKFYIDTTNVTIETGEGDITTDDGFTGTSVNGVLTFTGEIPYSTTKKGYLVNAVIDSAGVKGFDKDTATYQIGGGTKTAWGDGTTVVVPMAVADDTATQTVTVSWNGKAFNTQTFTMKLDEGVTWEIAEGAIEQDSGKTGGSGCNMTISGTTATVTGSIDWYAADATIGREEAGNRVGVKITAPSNKFDAHTATVTINGETKTWDNIKDGDGTYFLWYPLVTSQLNKFTAEIVWAQGMKPQQFAVDASSATLNPEPTTPPEPEVTATVVKNPPCDQSSSHLGNLVTGYNVTAGEVSNGVIPVTVSGTDLKYHQNANSEKGYWIGFGLEAPEGAEKVKYAFGAEKQDLNTLSGPVAFETNIDGVNGANSKGISFTANLLDAKPKVWAKVQWTKADGTPVTEEAVYQMDLSGVTCANEGVIESAEDVQNVLGKCDSVKFTYFDDNGIIEDLPEGAVVEYDGNIITLSGEVTSGLPNKAPYTDDFKTAQFDPEVAKNGYTACSIFTGSQTNVTIEQTNPALDLYPEDIWIGIARNSEGVPVKTKDGYSFAADGTFDLLLAGGMTEKTITVKIGSDTRTIVNNLTFKNTPTFTTENVLADGMNGVGISAAATTAETVDGVTHHTIAVTGTVTSGFGDNADAKTLFNEAVVNSGASSTKFTFCALKDLIPSGVKSTITQTNGALRFYGTNDATITDNVKSKLYDKTGPSPDCDYGILLREPDGGVSANVKIEIKNESGVLTDVYIITNHVTFS